MILQRPRDSTVMASSTYRRVVLAAVLVLLQGAGFLQAKKTNDATVIIIGAGMSGITAGKRLAEKGVTDILYLEAREEIGGRIYSYDFHGILIEKGANWIEGVGGEVLNPLIPLAKEINLINTYSNYDNVTSNIYDANGFVDPKVGVPAATAIEALYGSTNTLGVSLTKAKEDDVSVLSAQRFYSNRVPKSPVEMAMDYYINDYEFAEPPRVTSLKNTQPLPTFANYGQDIYFVHDPRGYVAIVHHLAHSFLQHKDGKITDLRLKLNKVVREVEYHKKGVRVTTEDGSVYTADYAMVSVSLGVLQSQLIDFVPDLPFWKLKSIYSFDMAIYTKIFVKFPSRFWDTNVTKFWLYADERRGYYPIWQDLDSEFPGEYILMVTVTDDESRRVEQQSDSETLAEIMVVLRTMFGKDIPTADSIYVPRWYTDRLFRGSFSNWPIGVDSNVFQQLQAPVKTVYFTGEHASEHYNGYVHGAYLQGIETANSLLDCILHHKCAEPSSEYKKLSKECNRQLDEERNTQKNTWLKVIARLRKELAEAKQGHC